MANHGKESVGLGLGGIGLGIGGAQEGEEWDPEQPMPVFEAPPAMLAVDLNLEPGEERSCECSTTTSSILIYLKFFFFYTLGGFP
jgi:hypothetical protein